jgi:hypothetical protein
MITATNYLLNIKVSIENLFNAIIGMVFALLGIKYKKIEYFKSNDAYISINFLVFTIISIGFAILYGYGAANLSYCYNKTIGKTDSEALLWAITAYFFSGIYYPYYGVFLNPTCSGSRVGGRR